MYIKNIIQTLKFVIYEPDYAVRNIKFRILNLFNYKTPHLKKISFLLTYHCNLSCSMCALGDIRTKNIKDELVNQKLYLNDIKEIIDFIQNTNSSVWLTGGEPLLNDRWYEIAEYVKKKKFRCYLQTNGMLLEKYKSEIINYVDFLNVSVDGMPLVHNAVRGEKDAFNKVLLGLREIDKTKKLLGRKKPHINICYTVTKESYKFIDEMINTLQNSEIVINNLNFQHLEFVNSAILERYKERFEKDGRDKNVLNIFSADSTDIDGKFLAEKIKELKKSKLKFNIIFSPDISFDEIKEYYNNPQCISKNTFRKCMKPYEEIFVHPSGYVWSCPSKIIGNIKEENFKKIWDRTVSSISAVNIEKICGECLGEIYMYQMIILYLIGKEK